MNGKKSPILGWGANCWVDGRLTEMHRDDKICSPLCSEAPLQLPLQKAQPSYFLVSNQPNSPDKVLSFSTWDLIFRIYHLASKGLLHFWAVIKYKTIQEPLLRICLLLWPPFMRTSEEKWFMTKTGYCFSAQTWGADYQFLNFFIFQTSSNYGSKALRPSL